MRVEILSDNVGDLIRATEQKICQLTAPVDAWAWRQQQAEEEQVRARKDRPLWMKVLRVTSAEELAAFGRAKEAAEWRRQASIALFDLHDLQAELGQRTAGKEAEDRFAAELGASLGPEWLLFRGYKTRGGEIDATLVGPYGLWAVEIKNEAIHVRAEGPSWLRWHVDGTGRATEAARPAVDNGGRAWSQEVGDPARSLDRHLRARSLPAPVRTAVLVLNERARIVHCVNPGVDLLGTSTAQFLAALTQRPQRLDEPTCNAVADVIRSDHQPN